ncbi:MAG: hypothetical protein KF898_00355 [Parachlamydiales bacterium]|nr:hypothetical protein [Verrucomicrobiota bacterium]MBX3718083.1 hypothetical protein [Candidatus Acheromyda pituitae]
MGKKHVKWILYFAAPVLLLLPFNSWYQKTQQFRSTIIHPQKTGITTLHLVDDSRQRPLVTEVWYPVDANVPGKSSTGLWVRCDEARDAPLSTAKNKYPLIVMSHGFGGDRFTISWLAEILAANGYIVAAMDHYGNTWNNKIPELYAKPWERPKDISFVLDELLENQLFKDKINPAKIGFAGYSLGGATGMWIAGAQMGNIPAQKIGEFCAEELPDFVTPDVLEKVDFNEARQSFHDKRISAVFTMAPALGWLFDPSSLKNIHVPICIVTTTKDQVVPMEANAKIFANTIRKASLKILSGEGDHYVFLNQASLVGKRLLAPRFCEDPLNVDRLKIHEDVGKTAVEFFNRHLQ